MAKITQKCVECEKEFEAYLSEFRIHCSVGCQFKKYEEHPPTCQWHRDWHACNCGAFNSPKENVDEKQLKNTSKIVVLENGDFFIPIPDGIIQKLGWKEGDSVHISETELCEDDYETRGVTICKVK